MADIIWKEVEKLAVKNLSALVGSCEYNFDKQIYDIADGIHSDTDVSIILIAGPSASGKTTSCNLLADRLEYLGTKVHRVSTDDFFIDRDKIPYLPSGVRDFDSLNALNLPLMQETVKRLLDYEPVQLPRYDFVEGKSYMDGEKIEMSPTDFVIIEGIHALNPIVLAGCVATEGRIKKISIAPRRSFIMENGEVLRPDELRLLRRSIRDYYTRNHSFEATLKQWSEVRAAEEKYITPYAVGADYFIDSVYEYELIVYKQCIYDKIKDTYFDQLKKIRRALADVNSMHIGSIPTTSLLNEFAAYGELDGKKKK